MTDWKINGNGLDFFVTSVPCPHGRERLIALAFPGDGTMWIDPAELGIGPQHAPLLAKFGGPYLLVHETGNYELINARAAVLVNPDAEWCSQWAVVCVIVSSRNTRRFARDMTPLDGIEKRKSPRNTRTTRNEHGFSTHCGERGAERNSREKAQEAQKEKTADEETRIA